MRRVDRQVKDPNQLAAFLNSCQVIRIAFKGGDYPYIVPMNFAYNLNEGKLIFYTHGAKTGKKLAELEACEKVAVELDGNHQLLTGPNRRYPSFAYQSIIGFGKAELIDDPDEKSHALELIMAHAAPGISYEEFPISVLEKTALLKIELDSYTMKENKRE
ncbi:MAG TPA: pyridoxamine 5'-phosphate oxidase family protein [Tetragenococcus sp.]|nr:pyridoxamine 5'-phosphate oxidase family protein [Tetragenococcus sp.]